MTAGVFIDSDVTYNKCSCNYVNNEELLPTKDIIISPFKGYQFITESVELLVGDGEMSYMALNDDGNLAFDMSEYDKWGANQDIIVLTELISANIRTVTVGKFIDSGVTYNKCSCNYINNEELLPTKDIIISPFKGYQFITESVELLVGDGEMVYMALNDDGNLSFDMSEYDKWGANQDIIVLTELISATLIPEDSPTAFVNTFLPSQNEMSQLADYVLAKDNFNFNQYIHRIYMTPFTLTAEDCHEDKLPIKLGYETLPIHSLKLLSYKKEYDLGIISVPLVYNNAYDYTFTDCKIYLPFIGEISLNVEYVVGGEIGVTYEVDLYDGTVDVFIKSNLADNTVIFTTTKKVLTDVPLVTKIYDVIGNYTNGFSTGIIKPYITVTRNIPVNDGLLDSPFGYECKIVDTLNTFTGYVEVKDITINSTAKEYEVDEIKQLLKSGVIV